MPRGIYDRTNAKKIQSKKGKLRWNKRRNELLESLKKRNTSNFGKKRSFVRFDRNCLVCDKIFEIDNTHAKENKKFCCKACYHKHQKIICNTKEYRSAMSNISKNQDRAYMQTKQYSIARKKDTTSEYVKYKNKVHKLSDKCYVENIDKINPNKHPRTLCGVDGGWQLDHIKSIRECFEEGIAPEEASSINNLRMLPWKQNLMRNYGDSI